LSPQERARETQVLAMNMADYWYEVDVHGGLRAAACYTEDGVFEGGGPPLVGRAAIHEFYRWRAERGERTSRHVVTNLRAEFADAHIARTYAIMMLYAADGPPVLPSTPPIIITDLVDECVKGADGLWLLKRRTFVPLFQGGAQPTVPPAYIAETRNA